MAFAQATIKDFVSLGWSGEVIEMENLFIILRLLRQCKLGRKGRSSRPGPARAALQIRSSVFILYNFQVTGNMSSC